MSEDKQDSKSIFSSAFAPSHITGFFKIYPDGSTGAGLNTDSGARSDVLFRPKGSKLDVDILINSEKAQTPVSNEVLARFKTHSKGGTLTIRHFLEYPAGYGMGMSGAGAFSLSLALNEVFKAKLSYDDCMQIAVEAEIASGTGLGDVIAQKYHGVMMGLPPYPSREVEIFPSERKTVACSFFEPLSTKSIIRDKKWKDRINEVGEECMRELGNEKTVSKFIELSRHFTFETKLASGKVKEVMKDIPNSSMAMLGQTVFLLSESEDEAKEELSFHCKQPHISNLATSGAKVIGI